MLKFFSLLFFLFVFTYNGYAQERSFQHYAKINSDGTRVIFSAKEDTHGSPYLFSNWANGKIILKNQQSFQDSSSSLNYDKVQHQLLMKLPENQVSMIKMDDIESFFLNDNSSSYFFVHIPEISPDYLVELYKGPRFSLYKSIETNFFKSDYQNKGLYESGYKYDRYVDHSNYFVLDNSKKVYNIQDGRKSELKALTDEIPEVKKYLKRGNDKSDLDFYLTNLVVFLNTEK